MGEVREHNVMETRKEAHFKGSQEKKSSVSGSFLEELRWEEPRNMVRIWVGGRDEVAPQAPFLVKRTWLIHWVQLEARDVVYKVASWSQLAGVLCQTKGRVKMPTRHLGAVGRFWLFVGSVDTQDALGCSVSLCLPLPYPLEGMCHSLPIHY